MSSGQLFVGIAGSGGSVGEYDGTGAAVNASFVSSISSPSAIAVSGSNVFVVNNGNTVSEYSDTGVLENATLIHRSAVDGIAISGTDIFVSDSTSGVIAEYTTSGSVVNASLISDTDQPHSLAIAGSDLLVVDATTNSIGEYSLSGQTINASLIDGTEPTGLAASGSDFFVADSVLGTVAEYTTAGATVNSSLISGLGDPLGISIYGSNLYVADFGGEVIGQYTTGGSTVNASLISGLNSPMSVFAVGPASKLVVHAAPTTATVGTALSPALVIHAEDGNGNVDSQESSNVTVAIASGTAGAVLGGTTTVAMQNGTATFSDLTLSKTGTYTLTATDGSFTAATTGSITVPSGAATQLAFVQSPTGTTAGSAISPAVTVDVEDADGTLVTGDTSNVVMSIASGPAGAALGGTTTVAAVGGVATFSGLTLSPAGAYTLTASDGSLTPVTSASFNIAVPAPNRLAFAQQPVSTTTTSVLAPVKVNVQNSGGTLLTGDTSSVTLTIATGPTGAVLGGTTTIAAAAGVATFSNLTLTTAGTYTLTATDGADTSATSTSFTISVPGANKLAFATQPQSTTTTATLAAVKVHVENSSGVLLTGDTSTVTLAIASGPAGAVLGGTASVAAVGGVATFSNLTVATAGTYTLTATDGADTAATSTSFMISVPGVNKLAFATQPQGATTSATLAAVKVNVENSAGILVAGDTSSVTLAIASGPVGAVLGGTVTVAAVGGVATFSNLTLATAGTYTLTATDGAYTAAVSTSFTISQPGVNKLAFAAQPQSATASTTLPAVKLNIQNSAGALLAGDSSTVTLAIASGPAGAVLGGTTSVAAVGGVATFSNLSFTTAGDYTLIATDGADTSATSLSFTISPPLANKLVFATQPVNGTITTGLGTITIDVENNAGTLLSSDNSSVTLTIATGTAGATLGGTTTVAAVNGVATFTDLFITSAGANYTLTASDGTDVPATSMPFSIATPTITNSLTFVGEPVNSNITGTLGAVTVDVTDSTGAVVTTDIGNVTLSITGSPAGVVLGGTTTVAAVNGVATFSDLTINTVGSYTLTATGTGDSSAVSTQFSVYYPPVTVGQLDPGFGSAGLVKSNVGFTSTAGVANDNGQVVVIGTTGTVPTESFSIARYNANGTLDTNFGTRGVTTIHFANTDDVPAAVAVLPGGQILIAGTATTYVSGAATTSQFAIAELNADGSVDTSFGNGTGEVLFGFSSAATHDVLTAMVVSSKGIIYLGGRSDSRSTTGDDFAIVALNSAGGPYASFGSGGQLLIDFDNAADTINALALQKNGDLVAAGSATVGGVVEIGLARVLPTGVLDRHFGTAGEVTTNVRGVFDSATSVAIQTNGGIVIGGLSAAVTADTSSTDFVVARYTAAGRLDRSFGGGAVVTGFSGSAAVTQVMIQTDGRIVAVGKMAPNLADIVSSQLEVVLARYTTRGVLDTAFDGSGEAAVDLSTATFTTSGTLAVTPVGAVSLATEANELIASGQGSALLNAGGEILAVGNSGANTVEAEVITHGVDLSAAIVTQLPAGIAGGTKSFANVQITENAADTAAETVTITLELTTDAQGNGTTLLKTLTTRINLSGGRSHTYRIPFTYPATNLPVGNYYLLASVVGVGATAMRELNQLNNLSPAGHTVTVTPPFITLAGSALGVTSNFTSGRPVGIEFTLTNDGNVLARGKTVVDIYLSTDPTVSDGTLVSSKPFAIAMQPGANRVYRQSFVVPSTLATGTYTLIAVVDPVKSLGSIDETSSTATDPTQLTIG